VSFILCLLYTLKLRTHFSHPNGDAKWLNSSKCYLDCQLLFTVSCGSALVQFHHSNFTLVVRLFSFSAFHLEPKVSFIIFFFLLFCLLLIARIVHSSLSISPAKRMAAD